MWWYTCAIPALGRQKQPYLYEFKDNLIYIVHLRELGLHSETVCLKTVRETLGEPQSSGA